MAPSLQYLIVRALLFLAPFAVLMVAGVEWWLSLIVALAFAFAASIVFFPKLRDAAAQDLQRMREGRKRDGIGPDDAEVEDAAIGDREPTDAPSADTGVRADVDRAEEPSADGTAADAIAAESADADTDEPDAPAPGRDERA